MNAPVNKSVEYPYSIQDTTYLVKVLIISASDDLEITNIDREENEGFIYTISVLAEPNVPANIFDISKDLIFIIGNGGINRLGYLKGNVLTDVEENSFIQVLEVHILEVLMIEGDSGHFTA
jgi:hypothetical protein